MARTCLRSQPRKNCGSFPQLHHLTCGELWPRPEGLHGAMFEENQQSDALSGV